MNHRLADRGNVADIYASLCHGGYSIEELESEIAYERKNKNRSTVIKMFESRIKLLKRNSHNE